MIDSATAETCSTGATDAVRGRRPAVLAGHTGRPHHLDTYDRILSNSRYTQRWVERLWGRESGLLHPPVAMVPPGEKAPIILSVVGVCGAATSTTPWPATSTEIGVPNNLALKPGGPTIGDLPASAEALPDPVSRLTYRQSEFKEICVSKSSDIMTFVPKVLT